MIVAAVIIIGVLALLAVGIIVTRGGKGADAHLELVEREPLKDATWEWPPR